MEPMLERIETQRQELKRQVRVLADNDRMRREFTANITHELKTPLTTVSGYAELIANGWSPTSPICATLVVVFTTRRAGSLPW